MRSLLWLFGILLALWLPQTWQPALFWSCVGGIALLPWSRHTRPLLLVALACCHAQHAARQVLAPWPDSADRLLVEASIDSVPAPDGPGWQFDVRASFISHPDWPGRRLRLRQPAGAAAPQVGERWQYAVQITPPRDAAARRGLLRDHLAGTGRIVAGPLNRRLAPGSGGIDALRARLAQRIADRVADPSASALLAALAVGVTGDVSTRQWQIFNATGITHLVAISGMHVTFFAMLSMAAARRLWRPLSILPCVPRREAFATATGVMLALLYALLSGFSVPAQRTVVMLAAFLVARQCARCTTPAWSVAVALGGVLLFDPLAALSAGFWLSFLAVAAIVLLAGARLHDPAPLAGAVQLQWLVTVALLPATVAIFGSFSAIGLLANAVAIPVFTLLLVPPVLLATAGHLLPLAPAQWCADWLVELSGRAAAALWPVLSSLAALPGALWWADAPWLWYLLAAPAAVLALLPLPLRLRLLLLAMLASAFLLREPRPRDGQLWIDVMDVGASTAVLLRTREHMALWGTGETFGSEGRSFARHVLPALRAAGHGALDAWFPGNLGRDTQAAVAQAAGLLPVRAVWLPPARGAPPEMAVCADRSWQWNGVDFALRASAGGRGCVLGIQQGGQVLLLGVDGDAQSVSSGAMPAAAALLLPRAAGSTGRLSVQPGQLLLGSLSRSEWESPAWQRQRVRLATGGATVLVTARDGRLRLRLDAAGIRQRRLHEAGAIAFSGRPHRL